MHQAAALRAAHAPPAASASAAHTPAAPALAASPASLVDRTAEDDVFGTMSFSDLLETDAGPAPHPDHSDAPPPPPTQSVPSAAAPPSTSGAATPVPFPAWIAGQPHSIHPDPTTAPVTPLHPPGPMPMGVNISQPAAQPPPPPPGQGFPFPQSVPNLASNNLLGSFAALLSGFNLPPPAPPAAPGFNPFLSTSLPGMMPNQAPINPAVQQHQQYMAAMVALLASRAQQAQMAQQAERQAQFPPPPSAAPGTMPAPASMPLPSPLSNLLLPGWLGGANGTAPTAASGHNTEAEDPDLYRWFASLAQLAGATRTTGEPDWPAFRAILEQGETAELVAAAGLSGLATRLGGGGGVNLPQLIYRMIQAKSLEADNNMRIEVCSFAPRPTTLLSSPGKR